MVKKRSRPDKEKKKTPAVWIRVATLAGLALVVLAARSASTFRPGPVPARTSSPTSTATPRPSRTPSPTATRTPPALPAPYRTSLLNPLDPPHEYLQEPCQALHDKWASTNSPPGTVAMVIMFHSISDKATSNPNHISEFDFRYLMQRLHEQGFQAITTAQLADFLEHNAAIPERSVLLVADDRHTAQYYNVFFRTYWEQYGWPVVNAWISTEFNTADLWQQQVDLHNEGWVDYQAHGVIHNLPMGPDSTDEYIFSELQGSIDKFEEYFAKKPIAIIWPGGGFAERPVEVARQLGYHLGFTVNPRGPLMFNWVPLSDEADPHRPSWLPEGAMGDPLMVLPRYWDTDAILHMDKVIQISQEAAAYAQENKAVEMDYYDIVCSPAYGPIP